MAIIFSFRQNSCAPVFCRNCSSSSRNHCFFGHLSSEVQKHNYGLLRKIFDLLRVGNKRPSLYQRKIYSPGDCPAYQRLSKASQNDHKNTSALHFRVEKPDFYPKIRFLRQCRDRKKETGFFKKIRFLSYVMNSIIFSV